MHDIYRGGDYKAPESSQARYMLLGESHYVTEPEHDSPNLTNETVARYLDHKAWLPFFAALEFAFGEGRSIWDRVIFANYLPYAIYKPVASKVQNSTQSRLLEQREVSSLRPKSPLAREARERFIDILKDEKPTHVFVFSRLAWKNLPELDEEREGKPAKRLENKDRDSAHEWGTLTVESRPIKMYGLEHPSPYQKPLIERLRRSIDIIKKGQESLEPAW